MTVDIFKGKTAEVIENLSGVKLVFFVRDGEETKIEVSKIEPEALTKIGANFASRLRDDIVTNEDLTLPLLTNIDDRKNALYLFDYDQKPYEFEILKQALELPPNYNNYYSPDNDFSDVKSLAVILSSDTNSIALYKNKTNLTVLKSNSNMLNFLLNKDGVLEEITSDIFKIDFGYDLILLDNSYYIKNTKTLEIAMKFHEVITAQASIAIESLTQSEMIEDMSHLNKSSKDLPFARKLAKVAKHSPVLGKIDAPTVIEFVSKHKYLSTIISINDTGDKFIVKTKSSQKHFIKLLSDDYLESELTKILYDSLAKDMLQ
ncbi:DUF4868 domain-containing protein [Hafnia paralvei]|uniref:anti-phage protein KwaB n=1 Tax=Hafnia paralvei TaxID=546367 RepID=UPI001C052466|nr:anti-phage protein KwaB [Hafnia paralvei]MBU2672443.1 DUF4868 domain-containing protein [Hafnia paralvei]